MKNLIFNPSLIDSCIKLFEVFYSSIASKVFTYSVVGLEVMGCGAIIGPLDAYIGLFFCRINISYIFRPEYASFRE